MIKQLVMSLVVLTSGRDDVKTTSDVTSCFIITSVQLWLRRSQSCADVMSKQLVTSLGMFYHHLRSALAAKADLN